MLPKTILLDTGLMSICFLTLFYAFIPGISEVVQTKSAFA
jgi:hypothetical protein